MTKIGFITDEASQNFEEAAQLAVRYGLTGLEIRSVNNKAPQELSDDEIKEIAAIKNKYGLAVPAISSPFFKCELESDLAEQMQILERCIVLAKAVGAKLIRGFTFWKHDDFDARLDEIVRAFDKPIEMLEAADMQMVLEFDPNVYACNATRLKAVIEAVGSPRVQALWDPGNLMFLDPVQRPEDGFALVSPYVRHVHLKDARLVDGQMKAVCLGTGEVDYKAHLAAIAASGYDGYYMLETHYRLTTQIDHALLEMPKGDAFSYMGYEATEESLQAWEKIRSNPA